MKRLTPLLHIVGVFNPLGSLSFQCVFPQSVLFYSDSTTVSSQIKTETGNTQEKHRPGQGKSLSFSFPLMHWTPSLLGRKGRRFNQIFKNFLKSSIQLFLCCKPCIPCEGGGPLTRQGAKKSQKSGKLTSLPTSTSFSIGVAMVTRIT